MGEEPGKAVERKVGWGGKKKLSRRTDENLNSPKKGETRKITKPEKTVHAW